MGNVLSPQSFGLHPPTRGYDSSDLLRRSFCVRLSIMLLVLQHLMAEFVVLM